MKTTTVVFLCLFDRAVIPQTDKSYFDMVAKHTFEKKGLRATMPDGSFFTGVSIPEETEDRNGKMMVMFRVQEVFAQSLEAGVLPVDLAYIPLTEAENYL